MEETCFQEAFRFPTTNIPTLAPTLIPNLYALAVFAYHAHRDFRVFCPP